MIDNYRRNSSKTTGITGARVHQMTALYARALIIFITRVVFFFRSNRTARWWISKKRIPRKRYARYYYNLIIAGSEYVEIRE